MSVHKRDSKGRIIPRAKESKTRGTYYYAFMIRRKRYREAIPEARTRGQAERAEVAAKEDVYNDRYGLRRSPLFGHFMEKVYLPWAEANKRSYATADKVYSKPLSAFFGKYKLAELTPLLIEKYKKERRATPTIHGHARKPASVNREIECLSRLCSLAIDNGELALNPVKKVRKLRADNRRTRYLDRAEEARLMTALEASPDYLRAMVVVAIQTGMRRGELLALRWDDVDFQRQTIYIRNIKDPLRSRDREIPMSRIAADTLAQLNRQGERPFPFTDIKTAFHAALRRAEIVNFRFHDLRHTAATRWAEIGATPADISALLGNSILVGQRYTHAIHANMRRIVQDANLSGMSKTIDFVNKQKSG